jgi:Lon-like ATP-dependent protease
LSIHNQNTPLESQHNVSNKNVLPPLAAAKCTPDFNAQLIKQNTNEINWLSIYPIVSQIIKHFQKLPQPLLIFNSIYWKAATSVIAASSEPGYSVHSLLSYNQEILFGRLSLDKEKAIDFQQGEIFNFNNGCLVLHISPLLVNPALWFLIKSFLITPVLKDAQLSLF